MSKTYEERMAAREAKRAMHKKMYRVKVEVQPDYNFHRRRIAKKIYLRDKDAAMECQMKYEEMLKQAIAGATPSINIEGTVIRSSIIMTYKVKIREPEPEVNPEIPEKLVEDEDD